MKTLKFFGSSEQSIPQSTAWYLADLGEYLGKQELYTRQSPQKLKALKEHVIIESAVSSNRIEGRDMIRVVLKGIQKEGVVECIGRGPGALWRKKG